MVKTRTRLLAVGVAGALALGLAACGGGGSNSSSSPGLIISDEDPVDHWDPQRIYTGVDISNATRLFYRQLVAYPISSDQKAGTTPIPDLATDTGKSTEGGKVWSFTLKDGIKWQDGSPITCDDFKYGASRAFATDVITGGPNYILNYLDVPHKADGTPVYDGPYKGDGQDAFDKAITCSGKTITYRFNKPWPDFPLAIASLHMMDPYKKSQDKGAKNDDVVFSNGPYKVGPGGYSSKTGGTFVRNPNYDPKTDDKKLREAKPDKITFKFGDKAETTYQKLFADGGNDQYTISSQNRIPPSFFSQIPNAKDRYTKVQSPYVDYLVPNFNVMKNPKVRQALAVSTDIDGWIAAGGGDRAYTRATSVVNPAVKGYQPNPAFANNKSSGDVEKAKQLLKESGEKMPYPITFTYQGGGTADKQAAALAATWNKAGFKVTLDPLADEYYSKVQDPKNTKTSVTWGGWGADWPSAITVTPALFDSTVNFSATSNGQDYGNYKSPAVNKLFDQARQSATIDDQTKYLQQADIQLGKDTAYIPLEISTFNWLHGSKVKGFTTTVPSSSFPDLGPIDVAK